MGIRTKIIFGVFFLSLLPAMAGSPEKEDMPEEFKAAAKTAVELSYGGEFERAGAMLQELSGKYPEHPFGYFGLAMIKWEKEYMEGESDHASSVEEYSQLIEKTLEIGRKWLKDHPGDANAHMCMGGMYGLKGMLYITQHKWLKAYFTGKKAIKSLKKALEIDPELYDAYLGLGLYEYSAATLPSSIKWLSKFVMPGDADKAIGYLELCREKGFFNAKAADLFLIEIFTMYKSPYANAELAVERAKALFQVYPEYAQIHFVYISALHFAGRYDEEEKQLRVYLERIRKNRRGYEKKFLPRALVSLATVKMTKGEHFAALEILENVADKFRKGENRSRWSAWGLVRMGNLYDILKDRKRAVGFYEEAAACPESSGFKAHLEAYLKNPFHEMLLPDPLSPPPWMVSI